MSSAYESDSAAMIAALLADFGTYLGIAGLALDTNRTCRLSFDEQIIDFELDPHRGDLLMSAEVFEIAASEEPVLLRRLFELGLEGGLAGIGSIGLNHQRIVWYDRIPLAGKTQQAFQGDIRRALARIAEWKVSLQQMQAAVTTALPDDVNDHMMIRA